MLKPDKINTAILDQLTEGVYYVDAARKIEFWNSGAEQITGYSRDEVVGSHCWNNIMQHVDDAGTAMCAGICPLARTLKDGTGRETHAYLQHKNGHRVPVTMKTIPVRDDSGAVTGAIEIFQDVSSAAALKERIHDLESMAMIDTLTGLANRRYLDMHMQTAIQELQRYDWRAGILFIDLDHFKEVNDNHGHKIGDTILQMAGKTILNSARSSDVPGRWGGDEFLVIINNVNRNELRTIAERNRMLLQNSAVDAGGKRLSICASVGATLIKPDDTVDSLVERADKLLYESKHHGRNRVSCG